MHRSQVTQRSRRLIYPARRSFRPALRVRTSSICTRVRACAEPTLPAMHLRAALKFALLAQFVLLAGATVTDPKVLDACPGYNAKNVVNLGHKLSADLVLAGKPCNVFGPDIEKLKLEVTYENSESSCLRPRHLLATTFVKPSRCTEDR
ncbi:hypothetical protein C8Q80DRAFT_1210055 [Daedaleopsis nitida]|nr:hypothetical protein C8Q80DRAFT_1210055 [Daedaleopsis nitida]